MSNLIRSAVVGETIDMRKLLIVCWVACLVGAPLAADWPQILGPDRNGRLSEGLPHALPEDGLQARWKYGVGEGMAGVAVVGDKVVVHHRPGDVERVEALSTENGASLWRSDAPTSYRGGILRDSGPRAVPTIHGDTVVTLGAAGRLRALRLADGTERWSLDLAATFGAPEGYFGFGSSPLVVDAGKRSLVVVAAGGNDAAVVALDLATGDLVWQAEDDRVSYASPVVGTVGGTRQVIAATRQYVVGLEPPTGRTLWRLPFGRRGPSAVGATPVVTGGRVLLTAAYGVGGRLVDLSRPEPTEVWSEGGLASHYPTPIVIAGHIYGVSGREDHRDGELRAFELETGKVLWTEKDYGLAHLVTDGRRLLAQRLDGVVELIAADPQRFRSLGRSRIAATTLRAQPAVSGGVLFVRTTPERDGGEVIAIPLR